MGPFLGICIYLAFLSSAAGAVRKGGRHRRGSKGAQFFSQASLHTRRISALGALRPVISSKASMAISHTTSSPSTITHDVPPASRMPRIW